MHEQEEQETQKQQQEQPQQQQWLQHPPQQQQPPLAHKLRRACSVQCQSVQLAERPHHHRRRLQMHRQLALTGCLLLSSLGEIDLEALHRRPGCHSFICIHSGTSLFLETTVLRMLSKLVASVMD
eukprot:gnl/TRDRNA2_/TRDRNA2_76440_c1_seq1.p2 gnl/TRDRNA2_/TRDRNA2_76440_c1~~gnl/TRDRNA2_/TRDRNA2_76440_c1_seq1.p2  ORF type:complete len:125 (+),score=22.56 gnl/TRDRNA2_/TRDRNA2_76440_c1_seq1:552-926(+)